MRKPVKFLLIGAVLLLLIGMLAAVQPARAFEGISSPAVLIQSNSSLLPDVPVLLSPLNHSLSRTYMPKLDWKDAAGAQHYELQVAKSNSFIAPLVLDEKNLLTSEYTLTSALAPNKTWFWRVRSYNGAGHSNWSPVWDFRTVIAAPVLIAPISPNPANPLHTLNRKPKFDWNDPAGVTGYTIQISPNSGFTSQVKTYNVSGSAYTPSTNLSTPSSGLYWRVQAKGSNGPSKWSVVGYFIEQGSLGCTACH